ncbi:hypothetical protein MC885_011413 [Smutsia gigantea]|nr:hypothetical protein MC885_011413 [Smutsia gigantea]
MVASVTAARGRDSSWVGVSEDCGYAASESSAVSVSEDASRRLCGTWERESEEEGSHCRGSWARTREDCDPTSSGVWDHCSGSWVTASEDRLSSRGLD